MKPHNVKFNIRAFSLKPTLVMHKNNYLIHPKLFFKMRLNALVPLPNLQIHGLWAERDVQTIEHTQPLCRLQGLKLTCQIHATRADQFIELPVLYYPSMLRVSVNNQNVDYYSILYDKKILVGIKAMRGLNKLTVEFIGLSWANHLSLLAWIIWTIIFASFITQKFRLRKRFTPGDPA